MEKENAETGPGMLDALTAIHTRRSVRAFTDEDVADEQVELLLRAAMAAPSAGNAQPWEFVIIRDKRQLECVGPINQYATFAPKASVGILICADPTYEKFPGFWIEDTSAATQNILLAAHALGLGAVWTGVYPVEQRMTAFRSLVGAPERIIPMAFVLVGHPRFVPEPVDRFKPERVHHGIWKA